MRNGLWPRVIKNMTQVTRAPGRNGPAFASSNHANSTPAAAAGAIENTTLLHASPPLVATDKSSNFSSAARMVSACQPMQPCPTYSAASNKPALQFRAQASGMPISTKSDSTAAKRGVAAHKPTAGEFIARAGKLLLLAASMAISVLSLAAPELHEASNALSPLAGYALGWVGVVGPGPGRQAPSAGPVGRVGCIWPATRFSAKLRPRVYPPRRAHTARDGASSPRFTGCAAGPVRPAPRWRAQPHHIPGGPHCALANISRRRPHRYHVGAVHADHAAYPTVPPSPPPQCTSAGGGCEARGMIRGPTPRPPHLHSSAALACAAGT